MARDSQEDIELDKTARAEAPQESKPRIAAGTVHEPPPIAHGTADTAPPVRSPDPHGAAIADTAAAPHAQSLASPRITSATRALFLAVASLGTLVVAYFVVRFVIAADPPALHAAFVGRSGGAFAALSIFDGPYLTLVRMIGVATIFLAISTWAAQHYRHEARVQIVASIAAVSGLYSIAVAVLTSSEPWLVARAAAACLYLALPLVVFATAVLFPNGRAVPAWGLYLIPVALVPFALQTAVMFRDRAFSVPIAAAYFPFTAGFFAMMWHRYRKHATTRERSQIKWLLYAGVAHVGIQAIAVLGVIPLLEHRESAAFPFYRILFELLMAASYLVALASVLFSSARYRVWDIDRVINRTIVYAIVTAMLLGVSVVGYFGLRAQFAGMLAPAASIAISLAIVVAAGAPLRRRISRWIDRRFYGIGLDYEALAAKAVRAAHAALPARTELGAYDELVLLGRGGMGAVYRAHHADFGVPVALKVMSPQLAQDADAQARFRRESQILEDLQHRNVVPFLAAGHEAGLAYIAMQYIDGEDLGALVRRRGPLAITDAAHFIDHIAAALELAHARGVIHRDIKPANVLVEGAPSDLLALRRALVMDFGVARLADDPRAPDSSLVGSLPYIAPEQIHNADAVDARADVYSLGATAYELVTGRPPFVETTALGLVLAHLHQPPLDPRSYAPALPESAALAILKALAKDPAQRYASTSAFAAAFTSAARP